MFFYADKLDKIIKVLCFAIGNTHLCSEKQLFAKCVRRVCVHVCVCVHILACSLLNQRGLWVWAQTLWQRTSLQLTLSEVNHWENKGERNLIGLHGSLNAGIFGAIW